MIEAQIGEITNCVIYQAELGSCRKDRFNLKHVVDTECDVWWKVRVFMMRIALETAWVAGGKRGRVTIVFVMEMEETERRGAKCWCCYEV